MSSHAKGMGLNATWSMAVGGMVGGGIFAVLGVVMDRAGRWAWLSFLIGGVIALATAYSYAELSVRFGESGGAFLFLREIHHEGIAGSLSWVLIVGYVLTSAVARQHSPLTRPRNRRNDGSVACPSALTPPDHARRSGRVRTAHMPVCPSSRLEAVA